MKLWVGIRPDMLGEVHRGLAASGSLYRQLYSSFCLVGLPLAVVAVSLLTYTCCADQGLTPKQLTPKAASRPLKPTKGTAKCRETGFISTVVDLPHHYLLFSFFLFFTIN